MPCGITKVLPGDPLYVPSTKTPTLSNFYRNIFMLGMSRGGMFGRGQYGGFSNLLQSQEQYNKIYLVAASPLAKVGGCNSGGLSSCYYIFGSNCCSQCCLNGFNCGVYCNNKNLNDGCCAA